MEARRYTIQFTNVTTAEANRYAAELRETLLNASPDVQVMQQRDDSQSQDFGATLVLILGTPAIIAIAQGIKAWLEKRNSVEITLNPNGQIHGRNLSSKDAVAIVEKALATRESE